MSTESESEDRQALLDKYMAERGLKTTRQRTLIVTTPFLIVRGRIQRQGEVVHIVAHEFERLDVRTDRLIRVSHDFR